MSESLRCPVLTLFLAAFPPPIRSQESHVSTHVCGDSSVGVFHGDPGLKTPMIRLTSTGWWWVPKRRIAVPHICKRWWIFRCAGPVKAVLPGDWDLVNTSPRLLLYLMDRTVRRSYGGLFNAANPASALLFKAGLPLYYPSHFSFTLDHPSYLHIHQNNQLPSYFPQDGLFSPGSSVQTMWDKANQIFCQPKTLQLVAQRSI